MSVLKSFRGGCYVTTTMSAAGQSDGGGGGGGSAPANAAFLATLPEGIRGNDAFKDVADVGALAQRFVDARTFAVPEKYTKADPSLKDFTSMDAVFDNLINARKMVGMDKSRIAVLPKDANDAEGLAAFYKAIGRPDKADGYTFAPKRADGTPYNDADKAFQASIAPVLHEMGLSQAQIDRGLPLWDQLQSNAAKAHDDKLKADMKATGDALRKEWGADFDGNVKLADSAIKHLSNELKLGDTLTKELNEATIGNNPALARLFAHLGKQLKEDGVLGQGGAGDSVSRETALTEIKRMDGDQKIIAILQNKEHPDYAETKAKRKALYDAAYPATGQAA